MPEAVEKNLKSHSRIRELESYRVMDTEAEEYLDELVELASNICQTPISYISLLDDQRQWLKSNQGLPSQEMPASDTFCKHTITQNEVFVVEDAQNDDRFKENSLVTSGPKITFYAGAPLITPNGERIGSLCIMNQEPIKIEEKHKRSLQLIAKNVMTYFNQRRKMIEQNTAIERFKEKIESISNQAHGALFQLSINPNKDLCFKFISKGILGLHPHLNIEDTCKDIGLWFNEMTEKDATKLKQLFLNSEKKKLIETNYTFLDNDNTSYTYRLTAKCLGDDNGNIIFNGSISDMTVYEQYTSALNQILEDLSHVIRRPLSNLIGLTTLLETDENPSKEILKMYAKQIADVTSELDQFVYHLDDNYQTEMNKALELQLTNASYFGKPA